MSIMSRDYLIQLLQKRQNSTRKDSMTLNVKPNPFIEFDADGLAATYIGKNLVYIDTATIQSNLPANRDNIIFYYEVHIKELSKNELSIGLADSDFPMNKHPGMTKNSFGYMQDGSLVSSKKQHKRIQRMRESDYIGCGINYLRKEVFFTHNGVYQGTPFSDVEVDNLYPTIGMHGLKQQVKLNFGQVPFQFDLATHINLETEGMLSSIIRSQVHEYDIHLIVQSYLYQNGYFDTLSAFQSASHLSTSEVYIPKEKIEVQQQVRAEPECDLSECNAMEIEGDSSKQTKKRTDAVEEESDSSTQSTRDKVENNPENGVVKHKDILEGFRKEAINLIKTGRSEECILKIQKELPILIEKSKEVLPNLYALAFIERIRGGDILEAVIFATSNLSQFQDEVFYTYEGESYQKTITIDDIMGLAAVSDYNKHPKLSQLLDDSQRQAVVVLINSAILGLFGYSNQSVLETLLKQLEVIAKHFAQGKYYAGEIYQLKV